MKARVYVTFKAGVLDPQGQAVGQALGRLGFAEVKDVRIGKLIEIELAAGSADEELLRLEQMCRELLANPVLENFRIEYAE